MYHLHGTVNIRRDTWDNELNIFLFYGTHNLVGKIKIKPLLSHRCYLIRFKLIGNYYYLIKRTYKGVWGTEGVQQLDQKFGVAKGRLDKVFQKCLICKFRKIKSMTQRKNLCANDWRWKEAYRFQGTEKKGNMKKHKKQEREVKLMNHRDFWYLTPKSVLNKPQNRERETPILGTNTQKENNKRMLTIITIFNTEVVVANVVT